MTFQTPEERSRTARDAVVVGAVALAAALLMVFVVFRMQGLVANDGDPYRYGEIGRGFLEHGFTTLTRRAASLYPELIALVYWFGGNNLTTADVRTVSLVPLEHQEARDVNARVGAGDNPNEEGEGEVIDFTAAENI